jgi:hypothetical protein
MIGDFNETEFKKDKEAYMGIEIPESLERTILEGLEKGKKQRKRFILRRASSIAAILILTLMCVMVVNSPALANQLKRIPAFAYILKVIHWDKGMTEAFEQGYFQELGLSQGHEGITLTLDKLVADEKNMVIFYTVDNKSDKEISMCHFAFIDPKGEHFTAGIGTNGLEKDESRPGNIFTGRTDVNFPDNNGSVPESFSIEVTMTQSPDISYEEPVQAGSESSRNDNSNRSIKGEFPSKEKALKSVWTFSLKLDTEKFFNKKIEYPLDKIIEIEGQKIIFKKVIVYPTRLGVQMEIVKENTKELFYFDDLRFENEEGEIWAGIMNGVSGFGGPGDDEKTIYLQSNYFTKPKELYLKFSSIRALDKDKCKVMVDLEKGGVLSELPQGLRITDINSLSDGYELKYELENDNMKDEKRAYNVFYSEFIDASGKKYSFNHSSMQSSFTGKGAGAIYIPKYEYKGNIILTIEDFSQRIENETVIRVK